MIKLLTKMPWARFMVALCILVLSGYATSTAAQTDASKERLAAFEATAQDTFNVAIWLRTSGLLSDEDIERLGALFSRMDLIRTLAYQSLAEGDADGVSQYLSSAQEILSAINSILGESIKNAVKRSHDRSATYNETSMPCNSVKKTSSRLYGAR